MAQAPPSESTTETWAGRGRRGQPRQAVPLDRLEQRMAFGTRSGDRSCTDRRYEGPAAGSR